MIPVAPGSNTPLPLGLPTTLWYSQVQVPQNQFLFHLFLKFSNALKSIVIHYHLFLILGFHCQAVLAIWC